MSLSSFIPMGGALITSTAALAVAIQNRRWITSDRKADLSMQEQTREHEAQATTSRQTAERLFTMVAFECPGWMREVQANNPDFAGVVSGGMLAVAPIRQWAKVLPVDWRLRIDCLASLMAHWGGDRVPRQLESDLADLLNGRAHPAPLDDDLARQFANWLTALCWTRYRADPVLRHLADGLCEVQMGSGDDNPVSRALMAQVTGRDEYIDGHQQGILAP